MAPRRRVHFFSLLVVVSIDGSLVCGSTLGRISCTGLVDRETLKFYWRGRCLRFPFLQPVPCVHLDINAHVPSRCNTPALTCIDIRCSVLLFDVWCPQLF